MMMMAKRRSTDLGKKPHRRWGRRHRQLLVSLLGSAAAVTIIGSSYSDPFVSAAAAAATATSSSLSSTSASASTSASLIIDPAAATSTSSSSSQQASPEQVAGPTPILPKLLSAFFHKFDTVGPTLTLTLRDPSSMALLGSSGSGSSDYYYFGGGENRGRVGGGREGGGTTTTATTITTTDDGTFGLSSKLAALFHISPTTTTTTTLQSNNKYGQSHSSSSSSASLSSTISNNGYMLDDGDIILEPPSSATIIEEASSPSTTSSLRKLFSMRPTVGNNYIIPNNNGWGKSWSECVQNVHPELRFEIHTKGQQPSSLTPTTTMPTITTSPTTTATADTRPFPRIAPWLSALSCGMAWRPSYPTYYSRDDEYYGYGHKLMSSTTLHHSVRAHAKISLPRFSHMLHRRLFSTSTSRGITNQFTYDDTSSSSSSSSSIFDHNRSKEVDLSITYQQHRRHRLLSPNFVGGGGGGGDGTVEFVLGTSTSTLLPATTTSQSNAMLDKYYHHNRNNHLLVRLATGRSGWGRGGTHHGMATTTTSGSATATSSNNPNSSTLLQPLLSSIEYIKGSIRIPNPLFLCSKGVSISPSYNFLDGGTARCVFSGEVGSSGRTRAVLRLDAYDATLTVVRALDDNKIIAPTISLNSGKIVYDYYLNLDGNKNNDIHASSSSSSSSSNRKVNSSIRAHVDPTTGIIIKWTDGIKGGEDQEGSAGGSSCWVTECRIPLGTSGPGPLASDVRVGRRWVIGSE